MNKFFVPLILGATRPNRSSLLGAKFVKQLADEHFTDLEVQIIDPNDIKLEYDGDHNPIYTDIVERASGFIILTPEYNHGYPGRLKTLLDSEYDNYVDKPVSLMGWSSGGFGGVRVIENLIPVVRQLGMIVTKSDMQFSKGSKAFGENGEPLDPALEQRVLKSLTELRRVILLVQK